MKENGGYTLSNITSEYMALRNISIKKYYSGYLLASKWAWKHLFQKTIYSTQSEWQVLRAGEPYNYVNVPKGTNRIFSVSEVDFQGNIVPLFYNNQLNIISKPLKSNCSCALCDCNNPLCGTEESLTKTTKLLFTIDGVDYYETTYLKLCKNGDIIEYKEIPTKKYNTFTGDGGDYNDDYNNDYLLENPPFADYTITTVIEQKILCKLDVKPCGCPLNTPENEEKTIGCCKAFLAVLKCGHKQVEIPIGDVNDNGRGHVKMSECGNKIYYKPSPNRHLFFGADCKLPTHLLINYQTTGEDCSTATIVPEYAVEAMFFGIDHYSKRFNLALTKAERDESKYAWQNAQNDLIMFLNPLSIIDLQQVQDNKQLW